VNQAGPVERLRPCAGGLVRHRARAWRPRPQRRPCQTRAATEDPLSADYVASVRIAGGRAFGESRAPTGFGVYGFNSSSTGNAVACTWAATPLPDDGTLPPGGLFGAVGTMEWSTVRHSSRFVLERLA